MGKRARAALFPADVPASRLIGPPDDQWPGAAVDGRFRLYRSASAGLHAAQPPGPHDSLEHLMAQADSALYQAKAAGRDRVHGQVPDME